ncbi:MAG: efflux RND transporter permease subunit, partial [Myxococcota bacterium]
NRAAMLGMTKTDTTRLMLTARLMATRFLRTGQTDLRPKRVVAWASRVRDRVAGWVARLARSPSASAGVVGAALALSIGAAALFLPPLEYLPNGNRPFVFGILVPPPGYAVEEMGRVGARVQEEVVPHIGREVDGVPPITRTFFVARRSGAFMGAGSQDPSRTKGVAQYMRSVMANIPGVFGIANQASLFGRSLAGGRQIEIELSGSSLDVLNAAGREVMAKVREVLPTAQARPNPPLDGGAAELHVRPRRKEAAQAGLTGADIGLATDALVDGAIIGEVGRPGEPKVDGLVAAEGGGVQTARALASAPVSTRDGRVLRLGNVATIERSVGPTTIRRIERRRAVVIQVAPPDDVALETALTILRDDVVGGLRAEGKLSSDIESRLSGAAGDLEDARGRFAQVLLLAVFISFLLMAALFEDFLAPVVVLVTVPLAAAGGILGLRFVDAFLGAQALDMLTAVGFVILIGVVVNNAILVVDGALLRLREGASLDVAVGESVGGRLRPILMSALTSLAGLSPLVFFPGSGSELYRGVGSIVLGGLALSTALTVIVVPALFSLVWRLGRRG